MVEENSASICGACSLRCLHLHPTINNLNSNGLSFFKFFMVMEGDFRSFLEIPIKLEDEDELSVVLMGQSGQLWTVKLCKGYGEFADLRDGWESFASDHSLSQGDIVVFNHICNTRFVVQVFGSNGNGKYSHRVESKSCVPENKYGENSEQILKVGTEETERHERASSSSRVSLSSKVSMDGDLLKVEPAKLDLDEDVSDILEGGGFLNFMKKVDGHDEVLSKQIAHSWSAGRVKANGLQFTINIALIAEATSFAAEGQRINRDKLCLAKELEKFLSKGERTEKIQHRGIYSGVVRKSLPKPWDRVVLAVMKYFTLDGRFEVVHGFHIAFLNHLRRGKVINIPAFLFQSIEKSIMKVKRGKASTPLHQGLLKIIFKHAAEKTGQPSMISRGVHSGNSTEAKEVPRRSKRLKKTGGSDKKVGVSFHSMSDEDCEGFQEEQASSQGRDKQCNSLEGDLNRGMDDDQVEAMQQTECEEDPRRSKRLKKAAGSDKKLGPRYDYTTLKDINDSMRVVRKLIGNNVDEIANHLGNLQKKIIALSSSEAIGRAEKMADGMND